MTPEQQNGCRELARNAIAQHGTGEDAYRAFSKQAAGQWASRKADIEKQYGSVDAYFREMEARRYE